MYPWCKQKTPMSQVCTAAAVTSMVSGVAVGLLALGERLPASPAVRLARLASWCLIMAGVTGLAAGSGRDPHTS